MCSKYSRRTLDAVARLEPEEFFPEAVKIVEWFRANNFHAKQPHDMLNIYYGIQWHARDGYHFDGIKY